MTYLLLYGVGWTQRWQLPEHGVDAAHAEIARVGRDESTALTVLDPGTGEPAVLVVAWRHVASALLLASPPETPGPSAGQYP